jgi:hypothetical protein
LHFGRIPFHFALQGGHIQAMKIISDAHINGALRQDATRARLEQPLAPFSFLDMIDSKGRNCLQLANSLEEPDKVLALAEKFHGMRRAMEEMKAKIDAYREASTSAPPPAKPEISRGTGASTSAPPPATATSRGIGWTLLRAMRNRRARSPDKTPDSSFVKETPKRWSSSFSQLASSFRKSKSRTVADASSFVRRLKGVAAEGSRHGMNLFSALGSTLSTSSATTSRADMAKEGLSSTCSSEDGSLNVGDECEAEASLSA